MADADRIKLSYVEEPAFAQTPIAIKAQGALTLALQPIGEAKAIQTLTIAVNPADGDTITIESKTYTFQSALTDVNGNVQIGGSAAATQLNLEGAINLTGTPGTDYALSMTQNNDVSIGVFATDVATLTALAAGSAGNSIDVSETFTSGSNFFGGATLLGGTDADTFTIGIKVYTLKNTLSAADGDIKIGASLADTQDNIEKAINLTGVAGVNYSTGMTANTDVTASGFVANVSTLTAIAAGTAANTLPLAETFASASNFFDAATLGNVIAGTDVQLKEIRVTSESLKQSTDTAASAELREDRQLADLIRTNINAEGDINTEISYESHEELMAGALFSPNFTSEVILNKTSYFTLASDQSINDESGNFIIDGYKLGSIIEIRNFTNAVNNGFKKIISLAAGKMVLRGFSVMVDEQDLGVAAQGTLTLAAQPVPMTLAQGTLTLDTNPTDGDTFTIGSKTYTLQSTLTDVDGNIQLAGNLATTKANIIDAINLTGNVGLDYAASMTINQEAKIAAFIADDAILTAKVADTAGNAVVTTEVFTAGTNVFDDTTLGTTTLGAIGDEVTIDVKVYKFAPNGDLFDADGTIEVGGSLGATQTNIENAINLTGTPGTGYGANMTIHPTVTSGAFAADDAILTAKLAGVAGNSIVTTETFTSGLNFFDAGTLGTTTLGSGNADAIQVTQTGEITNGTTTRFFTIEKEFTDLAAAFAVYRGMVASSMTMTLEAENISTGSFSFIGKKEEDTDVSIGTVAALELSTNPVVSAIEDTNAILEGGTDFGATQIAFTIENNLRPRPQIGELGAISIGSGIVGVTGTLQGYYEDKGVIKKYLNFTTSSLMFLATDAGGNVYIIDFPKVKYSDGERTAGGQNSDIIAALEFTAVRCPSEDVTIRIAKLTGPGIIGDC